MCGKPIAQAQISQPLGLLLLGMERDMQNMSQQEDAKDVY